MRLTEGQLRRIIREEASKLKNRRRMVESYSSGVWNDKEYYQMADEFLAQPGMVNVVMEAIREFFKTTDSHRFNVWTDGYDTWPGGDYLDDGWELEVVCPELEQWIVSKNPEEDPDLEIGTKLNVIRDVMELMHKSGEMIKGEDYGSEGWHWTQRPY